METASRNILWKEKQDQGCRFLYKTKGFLFLGSTSLHLYIKVWSDWQVFRKDSLGTVNKENVLDTSNRFIAGTFGTIRPTGQPPNSKIFIFAEAIPAWSERDCVNSLCFCQCSVYFHNSCWILISYLYALRSYCILLCLEEILRNRFTYY